jgi:hypothetical protein
MNTETNDIAARPLLWQIPDDDRLSMGEALQLLLAHGSIIGMDRGKGDLYAWCRQNLEWLREIGAIVGIQIYNDHESRLIQATPIRPALTLRLRQDATVVILALWYEFDTQVRDKGATVVTLTVKQLNQLLQERLLPDLKEPPSRARLIDILRMAQRFNLVKMDFADSFEESQIEVLPTLKRVIPFQDLAEWTRAAELHNSTNASGAIDTAQDEEAEQ